MENDIFQLIISQGAFAALFCYLLFYVLKENSKREENYQEILKDLSNSIPEIKSNIEKINEKLK